MVRKLVINYRLIQKKKIKYCVWSWKHKDK